MNAYNYRIVIQNKKAVDQKTLKKMWIDKNNSTQALVRVKKEKELRKKHSKLEG